MITNNNQCSSLEIVLRNEGILGGFHSVAFCYEYNGRNLHIRIEQNIKRTVSIETDSPISINSLWNFYSTIERLLMLFDGRFYIIESVAFAGDTCSEAEYSLYAQELLSKRLSYYKTDSIYCYHNHVFLMFDTVLSPELLSKWIQLQDELDIVHNVVLYNIADTGITHDIKCANFIECLEPIVEVIRIYDSEFLKPKPGDRAPTLKQCISAVISKYGQNVFYKEYTENKDKFLQTLVNTRHRIMHIKRNQPPEKYLSGTESVLYLVKLCHLYRVVLISLLGIDYALYQTVLEKSVEQWNSWNDVLTNFINKMKM